MTDKLTVVIFDAATGETTERPLTADELKQVTDMKTEIAARQVEADAKIAARASAVAKLAALGLTADEVAAL